LDFFEVFGIFEIKKNITWIFVYRKNKLEKREKMTKRKEKEKEKKEKKVETKEEYLPWHGRYSARLASKMGFSGWVGYTN